MARLLEQPVAARLGLAQLARRVGVRLRQEVAGLGLRGVDDLGALALRLGAVALDLGLALLQLALLRAHLLLGALQLRCRRGLRVALERVGELGAARIRWSESMRTACPVGSTFEVFRAAWSTRSCACSWAVWRRKASNASRTLCSS